MLISEFYKPQILPKPEDPWAPAYLGISMTLEKPYNLSELLGFFSPVSDDIQLGSH